MIVFIILADDSDFDKLTRDNNLQNPAQNTNFCLWLQVLFLSYGCHFVVTIPNKRNTINIRINIPAEDVGWNKKPNSPTNAMK
jgi:hypothetical protein